MPPFAMEMDDVALFGNNFMDEVLADAEDMSQSSERLSIVSHDSEPDEFVDAAAPAGDMDSGAIANRSGRSSRLATPAKTPSKKTPRSTMSASAAASVSVSSAASSSRKRKASAFDDGDQAEPTPAKRRGRPRRAVPSARLAAKAATKPTRGRPKKQPSADTVKAPSKASKRCRPKKNGADDNVLPGEYEVEDIVESAIDADTMEHMYRVKWKGYTLKDSTWEPRKNLKHAADLVRKFDAKTSKPQANGSVEDGGKREKKKPGRKPKAR